jgi:hypothetical protein
MRPGVEVSAKSTTPENWSDDGVARAAAHLVSRDDQGRPAYGGTPSNYAVVQAIREIKARGHRVTFYPFILMDVAPDNTLPDPTATTPLRPASRPIPGEAASPARRPPVTPAALTRAPPPARRSPPSSATPSRPASTSMASASIGPAIPTTGACSE